MPSHQRQSGMTRLQRATLDSLHPQGWTVASWLQPDIPLDPADRQLGEHDNPNLFGGGHFVINGVSTIITRRGKWIGHYAWGGRQIPLSGQRRPWGAIVGNPAAAGCYGASRTPRKTADIITSRGL